MSASFKSRRKAVKIVVDEGDEVANNPSTNQTSISKSDLETSQTVKYGTVDSGYKVSTLESADGKNTSDVSPVINKRKSKKKKTNLSSRLSFGSVDSVLEDSSAAAAVDKNLTSRSIMPRQKMAEAVRLRKGLSFQKLYGRLSESHRDTPTYSKDYLNELKSSTPTKRHELYDLEPIDEHEEKVAISLFQEQTTALPNGNIAVIPSEAEIREKKERRAKLSQEADFISFNDDGNDRQTLTLQCKVTESRLVRDDEDFAEGFDEFVEDGKIALGKIQESQARRRKRQEMSEMIQQAERASDAESDDSEAERCTAYDHAQTRAGMDGLRMHEMENEDVSAEIPVQITPLPILSECLERFQKRLNSMEMEQDQRREKLLDAEQEEQDIAIREKELQALLIQAGDRLAAMMSGSTHESQDSMKLILNADSRPETSERGLENYGN
ncbi:hypothetical protein GcM1_245170 [Golovinomyces cichoracearum]|uniref:Uncharacterized protein n=1 Tax=Golovinomyces cichoracearum TaxID=62708 RepID=A0A420IFE8_9PEZI|nr:hypothetical protein GcM1_245170 [Golovinomyces cichoracearum]